MSLLPLRRFNISTLALKQRCAFRNYATELPRPPPSTAPPSETFSEASRPRPYYAKHPPFRDLPREKPKWPIGVGAVLLGVAGWSLFMTFATNQEQLSSSVFRSVVRAVKVDSELREKLGDAIRPQPEWYMNGDPHVKGHISQLQGNIDISFRIRGSKGSGTLYFTSIRKEKGVPFTVLRFRVICDDGTVINISDSAPSVQ
ncbi:cytochrome oxidase complex assembly protein 1-domain-containing protein [Crepidotus variabilis]|uniref:Cytochrome oxidase complex assembly protein 1-domain-containing protein n=1 Tax=Crepidotus variabilis TaxID=179855 RepID=A0A9P6EPR5_9AGAR|nr:cytochrome oxidase complex assembly protein 1-domain-containing protein [Crepidotus variabilis]